LCVHAPCCRTRFYGNYDANTLAAALALHNMVGWCGLVGALAADGAAARSATQSNRPGATTATTPRALLPSQEVTWHDARDAALDGLLRELGLTPDGCGRSSPAAAHGARERGQLRQQQQQEQRSDGCQHQPGRHGGQPSQQPPQPPELVGIVVNVPARGVWSRLTGGRHWLAVRRLEGRW
jgi:hypothetical protein